MILAAQVPENAQKSEKELKNGHMLKLEPHPFIVNSFGTIRGGPGSNPCTSSTKYYY